MSSYQHDYEIVWRQKGDATFLGSFNLMRKVAMEKRNSITSLDSHKGSYTPSSLRTDIRSGFDEE